MSIANAVAVFTATAGATLALLKLLEDVSNKASRNALADWLLSDQKILLSIVTIPHLLRAMAVSALAGTRKRYLLAASAMLSAVATCLLVLVMGTSGWRASTVAELAADPEAWRYALVVFASGVIPDFVSLLKTRFIVLSDALTRHAGFMLVLDAALSLLLAVCWVGFVALPVLQHVDSERPMVYAFPNFLTALAPTALTALLVLYAVTARAALRLVRFDVRRTRRFLNYADKPFQSLGLLIAPMVGFTCAILFGFSETSVPV